MVNFPGRNGRRRRVLNDEVLSATSSHVALRAMADEDATHQAPRYSDAAGVENHAQVTDFVPRRYRTIMLLLLFGLTSAVSLAALHYVAPSFTTAAGSAGVAAFDLAAPGNLAAWLAAVVLLLTSAMCLLIYSIRRHRIDDYRGRYRIWLAASGACLLLSANSVAGLHDVLAYTLSYFTGWSALRAGAVWWLALAGPPLAWIAFRTLIDVKECRLATLLLMAAAGCYIAATAGYLGFVQVSEPRVGTMIHVAATLVGHWLLLAAVVSYARFVVLDAQGLVPARRSSHKRPAEKAKGRRTTKPATSAPSLLSVAGYTRQQPSPPQAAEFPADAKDWVDGTRPERKHYDDDGDDDPPGASKLSKADRKRLRKLKAQNRAA